MRQASLFAARSPAGPTRPAAAPPLDGHVLVDATGCIVDADDRAQDLLGYERGQMLGNDVGMLLPAQAAFALALMRERHLARRQVLAPARFRRVQARRGDGTLTDLLMLVREHMTPLGRRFSVALRANAAAPGRPA